MAARPLRDRLVTVVALAGIVVTGSSAENPGSGCHEDPFINGANLWRAVSTANTNGKADEIEMVEGCVYQLRASLEIEPDPTPAGNPSPLTIYGNGATIRRIPASEASQPFRVVDVRPEAVLLLDGVTITGGRTAPGDGGGAGIRVGEGATMVLSRSTVRHNRSPDVGAALAVYGEAGVSDSTIRNNKSGKGGSVIEEAGRLEMAGSTISRNTGEKGSTIRSTQLSAISNSTVTSNEGYTQVLESTGTGRLFLSAGTVARNEGSGIRNGGAAEVRRSIVADNQGPSCSGMPFTGDSNLSADGTCPGMAGSRLLGLLADNGGITHTRALKPGSAAIDAGPCDAGQDLYRESVADQRGVPRDGKCDTGAFEFVDSDRDGRDDGAG